MSTTGDQLRELDNPVRALRSGVDAVVAEDYAALSDAALTDQIGQLEAIVDQLDSYLTRLANTVLARTFVISEVGTT